MRFLVVASMLLVVTACGQQNQQDPASPEAAAPSATTVPLPDWAAPYAGQAFAAAFPDENQNCAGSADSAGTDGRVGRVTGWSWDRTAGRPYDRLISVGADGIINGAGTTTRDRPDVPRNTKGMVTDPHVGFEVVSSATSGRLRIAAVDPNTNTACWIDQIDIAPPAPAATP